MNCILLFIPFAPGLLSYLADSMTLKCLGHIVIQHDLLLFPFQLLPFLLNHLRNRTTQIIRKLVDGYNK